MEITQKKLKEIFYYDKGNLYWNEDRANGKIKKHSIAGRKNNQNYIQIRIKDKKYQAHRLIYIYHFGELKNLHIDHVNGIRYDNRIENLRAATIKDNHKNRTTALGYSYNRKMNKYHSRIGIDGKVISIGYYDTQKEARLAYLEAKKIYHVIF